MPDTRTRAPNRRRRTKTGPVACHGAGGPQEPGTGSVLLVGNPNVGKSVLFGALTGAYVTVSNYPGTTVEVTRGVLREDGRSRPVVDLPGIQSLVPQSDDERAALDALFQGAAAEATVVLVMDAKNLERALVLAFELADTGIPFVVALNMVDEAEQRGIRVDAAMLSEALGVPVVPTVATAEEGLRELASALSGAAPGCIRTGLPAPIERALADATSVLPPHAIAERALAVMALTGDDELHGRLGLTAEGRSRVAGLRRRAELELGRPAGFVVAQARLDEAARLAERVTEHHTRRARILDHIGHWTTHPLLGWPILAAVLWLMYLLVGTVGAGTVVDFVESVVFGKYINPAVTSAVDAIPFAWVRDFLVGDYGLVTVGLTYALALILPIASFFFVAFAVLEDSGYLPRLGVMLDRVFRFMGLNGKAVLPMILGLGCDTMATTSTRILSTRRERVQVTLLLALGVPCSAQLGVVMGMLAGSGGLGLLVWVTVLGLTILAVGFIANRLLPGTRSEFILELPPLRRPSAVNVAVKTAARVEWYLKEVVPIFLLGTAVLFVLDRIGLLDLLVDGIRPVVTGWLGLPAAASSAFLMGFLRRDYGAAGLYVLASAGALSPLQVVVSLVTITLFVPCLAQLMMMVKEFGAKTAIAVSLFVFPFAFLVGGLVNLLLRATGMVSS